jgi:prolyl-tRNA synthetase
MTAKAVFYANPTAEGRLVLAVLMRGDREVNESPSCAKVIQMQPVPQPADEAGIRAGGAVPGFASPIGNRPVGDPARVDGRPGGATIRTTW